MNLLIDIGNTFTHFGVAGKSRILFEFKVLTHSRISASEINKKLSRYERKIESAAISTVVPSKTEFWKLFVSKTYGIRPLVISGNTRLPIKIKVKNPGKLGPDRICNAVAGYYLFKKKSNVIVIDLGTATTYDVILKNGDFVGGIISPGIETSAKALHGNTDRLPMLKTRQFLFPRKVIGRNTLEAIQSGLMYTASFTVDGMIKQIEKERHCKFKIVLTGGFAKRVFRKIEHKAKLESGMVFKGSNYILQYNSMV